MRRPISITILALYLIVVFGLALVGSMVGAVRTLPPYDSATWLLVAVPQALALVAGIALWRMLRIGAWLWSGGIILGWTLLFVLHTGFFPSAATATIVSFAIIIASAWVLVSNWRSLRPLRSGEVIAGVPQ